MHAQEAMHKVRSAIAQSGLGRKADAIPGPTSFVREIPPTLSAVAAMNMRLRTWKTLYFVTVPVLLAVNVTTVLLLNHKMFGTMENATWIVPGAPDFIKVRPNQIPDEAVFSYAEFVAQNLGNFTYKNVRYHFEQIMEYMHPELRGRFGTEVDTQLKDWQERRVDQTFAYEPVRKFDIKNDKFGPKFVVAVPGMRTQYVEGHVFSESKEVLLLELRPRTNITKGTRLTESVFQIEQVTWLKDHQFEALQAGRSAKP